MGDSGGKGKPGNDRGFVDRRSAGKAAGNAAGYRTGINPIVPFLSKCHLNPLLIYLQLK